MDWISVEDRLPELVNEHEESSGAGWFMPKHRISKKCLVVINGNVTDSKLLSRDDMPNKTSWQMLKSEAVTHWMYYPEPPKD